LKVEKINYILHVAHNLHQGDTKQENFT